jgi:hypothetical protein
MSPIIRTNVHIATTPHHCMHHCRIIQASQAKPSASSHTNTTVSGPGGWRGAGREPSAPAPTKLLHFGARNGPAQLAHVRGSRTIGLCAASHDNGWHPCARIPSRLFAPLTPGPSALHAHQTIRGRGGQQRYAGRLHCLVFPAPCRPRPTVSTKRPKAAGGASSVRLRPAPRCPLFLHLLLPFYSAIAPAPDHPDRDMAISVAPDPNFFVQCFSRNAPAITCSETWLTLVHQSAKPPHATSA